MSVENRLENGDPLPSLTAATVRGGEMTLPDDLEGDWGVVVFYRGHF